jgi:hypothetical protein
MEMARESRSLKISRPLRAVLRYVGVVRGGLSPRQVGEEVILKAIKEHPLGAQLLTLTSNSLRQSRKESRDE